MEPLRIIDKSNALLVWIYFIISNWWHLHGIKSIQIMMSFWWVEEGEVRGYTSNYRVISTSGPSLFPDFGFGCIALRNPDIYS